MSTLTAATLVAFYAGFFVFSLSASPEIIQLEAKGDLGRDSYLRCVVVPPPASVLWLLNGNQLNFSGELLKITNETLPMQDKDADGNQKMYQVSSLHINKTPARFHGNYTCLASTDGGTVERHVILDLSFPASSVGRSESPVRKKAGQPVTLSCTFKGFGLMDIKWKKESDVQKSFPVADIETKIINETHTISSLNLTDLSRKDNGTYLCSIYDPISKRKVIQSIDILVLDRPQVNIDYVKAVGQTKIFLNWTVNTGNSRVESYTLQYRKNGSETWTYYSHPVGGGNTSFVMEGLEPSTEYQLKISAKNALGTSQVSTHTSWIKTLDTDPRFIPEPTIKGFTVSSVTIGWVPPTDEQAEYIHYYELVAQEKNNNSSSKKMAIQDYRNLPYMFDKLAPATTYIFKVRACSELTKQCGEWSPPVNGSTLDGTAGPPAGISVTCARDPVSHADHLTVTWEPPENPNGKIVRYNVELTGSAMYINDEGHRVNATWGPKTKYAMETSRTARFDNLPPNTNYTVQVSGVTRTKRPGVTVSAHCSTGVLKPSAAHLQRFRWHQVKEYDGRFMFKLFLPRVTERNGPICCYRVFLVRLPRYRRVNELPPPENLQIVSYREAHAGDGGGAYVAEMFTSDNFPQQSELILGDGVTYIGANDKSMEQCRVCAMNIPQRVIIKPTRPTPMATSPRIPITENPADEEKVESYIPNLYTGDQSTVQNLPEAITTSTQSAESTEKNPENLVETAIGKDDEMDQAFADERYTLDEEFYVNKRISHQNKRNKPELVESPDVIHSSEQFKDSQNGILKRASRETMNSELLKGFRRLTRQISSSENFERIMSEQGADDHQEVRDKDRKELDLKILNVDTLQRIETDEKPRNDMNDALQAFDGSLDLDSNYTGFIEMIVHGSDKEPLQPVYTDYFTVLHPGPGVLPADGEDTVELALKITCGVMGAVLLLTIITCAIHTHRRRKARPLIDGDMHPLHATWRHIYHGMKSRRHQLVSTAPADLPPIAKEDLPAAFIERQADSDYGFQREFEMLPDCFADRTTHASEARENQSKNRYPDIKAYDQTRVKLSQIDNVPGSDYINANYVMGYKERKKFICAQGPTDTTVNDFWRMIWEQDLQLIVMLTNLEEHSKVKCSKYWPDEPRGKRTFGGVTVRHVGEKRYSDYIVRELRISRTPMNAEGQPIIDNNGIPKKDGGTGDNTDSPTEGSQPSSPRETTKEPHANGTAPAERVVRQFHFLVWKDFVAPEYPQAILKFIKRIDEAWSKLGIGSCLVHCSAGVGRTGSLVALHCLLQQLDCEGSVNVMSCVAELRRRRALLVQNLKQYIFVYRALVEYAYYGDTEIPASRLKTSVDRLRNTPEGADKCLMEVQFERMLTPPIAEPTKSTSSAALEELRNRNRSEDCLPYDANRVILAPIPARDHSTYINASFVEGYDNTECYIITQDPMPNTIADFWRMVLEQGVSSIVMLSELGETERKCPRYWDDGVVQLDHISVQYQHSESSPYCTRREFRVTNNKSGEVTVTKQLQYHGWPTVSGQVPEVTRGLAELADAADPRTAGPLSLPGLVGPVLVHCNLGTERSPMFIALCILICQLRTERRVDVASVTRKIRAQRSNTLTTFLQYEFLHRAILNYAELHNLLEDS